LIVGAVGAVASILTSVAFVNGFETFPARSVCLTAISPLA